MNDLHPIGDSVRAEAQQIINRATAPPEPAVLLTVKRTAEVLDCSPRTVRRRIHDGTLPAVLERGRLMVRSDELIGYIADLQHYGPARARVRRRPTRRHVFDL